MDDPLKFVGVTATIFAVALIGFIGILTLSGVPAVSNQFADRAAIFRLTTLNAIVLFVFLCTGFGLPIAGYLNSGR